MTIPNSIIRGAWQLTPDHAHGGVSSDLLAPIVDSIDHGFTCFDCADIYPGVEELLGLARLIAARRGVTLRIHTKLVPDRARLGDWTYNDTQRIVDRSLMRLGVDALDLVQFHWWDYSIPGYIEALQHLERLQQSGKVLAIGLTNFGTSQLREVLRAGTRVATLQLQYSLIDRRCEREMVPLCRAEGIDVYSYGALLGGFLSERWIGRADPGDDVFNRSLVKYKRIIDDWGGWARYQRLLLQLQDIAHAHHASVAQVALSAAIGSGYVQAAIVGLSQREYAKQSRQIASLPALLPRELDALWGWSCPLRGDVYELERTSTKHASIMKYDLQKQSDLQLPIDLEQSR